MYSVTLWECSYKIGVRFLDFLYNMARYQIYRARMVRIGILHRLQSSCYGVCHHRNRCQSDTV